MGEKNYRGGKSPPKSLENNENDNGEKCHQESVEIAMVVGELMEDTAEELHVFDEASTGEDEGIIDKYQETGKTGNR